MDHEFEGWTPLLKSLLCSMLWLALMVRPASALTDSSALVRSVSVDADQIVILLSAPGVFQQATLSRNTARGLPDRCYVDITPASLGNQVRSPIEINSHIIQRVRTGQFRPDTVRIVLDLVSAQTCHIRALTEPDRLTITVGREMKNETEKYQEQEAVKAV